LPFFTFYSMFGFQRVGDLIWSAADSRARGFLLGATAGRTTLLGEGLQHQDGHSHVLASTVPSVEAWDPAFAYEMAVIIRHGIQEMLVDERDVVYYLTLYNENYLMPPLPEGAEEGILRGLYKWADAPEGPSHKAAILFSGPAQGAARAAQAELAERWDVGAELWSATSYKRLREEALTTERWNRLHPTEEQRTPLVTRLLGGDDAPSAVVAVTDYMKAVPDQIGRWVPKPFVPLGTPRAAPGVLRGRHAERRRGHPVGAGPAGRGQGADGRRRHRPLRHRHRAHRPAGLRPLRRVDGQPRPVLRHDDLGRAVERLAVPGQPQRTVGRAHVQRRRLEGLEDAAAPQGAGEGGGHQAGPGERLRGVDQPDVDLAVVQALAPGGRHTGRVVAAVAEEREPQ